MSYLPLALAFVGLIGDLQVVEWAKRDLEREIQDWRRRAMASEFLGESRDVASQHLESGIHASHSYAMLRRITGLAPLLGVIYTAIALSITSSSADDGTDTAGGLGVLVALRPVFWGVVLGAALSILNQILVVRFESMLRTRVRDCVNEVPADRFARIHDILGTFPQELRAILAALTASHRAVQGFQRKTTEEMGMVLTRVSAAVLELADSATKSGEKLRESAASHFDQVKVTTKEFGKTIAEMSEIVEKSNAHVGGVLSAASDRLGDAQIALAKSMEDIQVGIAEAVRSATGDLAKAATRIGGLSSPISSLERQLRESGSQSELSAGAAASLSKALAALDVSVATTQKSLQSVTESVVARHADWDKRVDASEGRLDAVAARLADGILSVQREVVALAHSTKSLAVGNGVLAEQMKAATAKLEELHIALKEPEKPWFRRTFRGR